MPQHPTLNFFFTFFAHYILWHKVVLGRKKIPKKFEKFWEIADFGSKPASLVLLVIISAKKSSVGKTDLTRLLDELETFPIALNEALFEGYKCPSKVKILKIVLGGLPHL